jgi:hypothetical protein
VTDWTLILTTVGATIGAAGITGLSSYHLARKNGEVALRQVEAENERLRAQHSEDHLRNRQGTYHNFLNAERRFEWRVLRGEATQDDFLMFNDIANGVALFGAQPVAAVAAKLVSEYGAVFSAAQQAGRTDAPGSPDQISAAYQTRKDVITQKRSALVHAMRADVAPDTDHESSFDAPALRSR